VPREPDHGFGIDPGGDAGLVAEGDDVLGSHIPRRAGSRRASATSVWAKTGILWPSPRSTRWRRETRCA
jgi:hypothetical protein